MVGRTAVYPSPTQRNGATRSHFKFDAQRLFCQVAAEGTVNDVTGAVPQDDTRTIALSEQLNRSQADQIRAETHLFAEIVRAKAEQRFARIVADAKLDTSQPRSCGLIWKRRVTDWFWLW